MIEIVLSLCLIDNRDKCREEHLTFAAEKLTLHGCMMYGQFEIAKHMAYRPRWRVSRWRCGPVRETANL